MGEDEDSTLNILSSNSKLWPDLIQQYQGRVVNTAGDSLLAEFASVVDAVQCAVEIQKELGGRRIRICRKIGGWSSGLGLISGM